MRPRRIQGPGIHGLAATGIRWDLAGPGARDIGLARRITAHAGWRPAITDAATTLDIGAGNNARAIWGRQSAGKPAFMRAFFSRAGQRQASQEAGSPAGTARPAFTSLMS